MNFTQISQGQKSLFTKRIIFTILLFLIFQDANARRWYVNPNKLLGVFDGGSWTTAYNNLGQCLPNVTAGDEVWITRGKDRPYGSGRDKTIEIPSGVKLYGAFGGFETSISQRRFDLGLTILTGNVGDEGTSTDNSYHVVTINNSSSTTRLDGFEITAGNANGLSASNYNIGAALYINGGSPVIANCNIISNYATKGAGIGIVNSASVKLDSVTISGNTSENGGGIYLNSGNLNVVNSRINSNNSNSNGAVFYSEASVANVFIDRSIFSSNYSNGPIIYGSNSLRFEMYNSMVIGNLTNSHVVYIVYPGNFKSINSTFSGNTCSLANSYIVFLDNNTSLVRNSIFWGNEATANILKSSPFDSNQVRNCIIQNGFSSGKNILTANPGFVNAGFPQSAPFLASDYNYTLTTASPGIDAGDSNFVSPVYTRDLNNFKRTQGFNTDLGAYEKITFVLSAGNDVSICQGASTTLTATGATAYLWNTGDTARSIVVSPTSSTNYVVTGTSDGVSIKDTVFVFVKPTKATYKTISICEGRSYNFNGRLLYTAGTYRDTLQQVNTCDSIDVLTLNVLPKKTTNISQSINSGQSYNFNGMILNTQGTYMDTLTQFNGCDSIIILNLSVLTGVKNNISFIDKFSAFPNPAQDFIHVELVSKKKSDFNIYIFDETGQAIYNRAYIGKSTLTDKFDLSQQPKGIYYISVYSEQQQMTHKIIK
jgi:hypothetical protein